MTDTDRVTAIERELAAVHSRMDELQGQLLTAELEQWRGRIEDLEVRAHLASMDIQDRLEPIVSDLRDAWLDAKASATRKAGITSDVVERLRLGLDRAGKEFRSAVKDAKAGVDR